MTQLINQGYLQGAVPVDPQRTGWKDTHMRTMVLVYITWWLKKGAVLPFAYGISFVTAVIQWSRWGPWKRKRVYPKQLLVRSIQSHLYIPGKHPLYSRCFWGWIPSPMIVAIPICLIILYFRLIDSVVHSFHLEKTQWFFLGKQTLSFSGCSTSMALNSYKLEL